MVPHSAAPAAGTLKRPLIIAHRGASGDRPEHGMSAHRLAIEQGAEVIEPDLVLSADGVAVVRHDLGLRRSTDVASVASLAGSVNTALQPADWLAADLRWDQLRTLHCVQPWPERPQQRNRVDTVLRLEDLLQLARAEGRRRQRRIIVYAETKQPNWHAARGLDFVAAIGAALERVGELGPYAALWMQSFEWDVLDQLQERFGVPGYALIDAEQPFAPAVLGGRFAGVGIAKQRIDPRWAKGRQTLSELRAAGLQVHAWTFRHDHPGQGWDSAEAELAAYLQTGVDALFCDFPGRAKRQRDALQASLNNASA